MIGTNSLKKSRYKGFNQMIKRTKTTNVNKLPKINKFEFSNCTNLVLYGLNLASTRFSVSLQKLIYLPPDSYSMVVIIIRRRKLQFKF